MSMLYTPALRTLKNGKPSSSAWIAVGLCLLLAFFPLPFASAQPADSTIVRGKHLLEVGYDAGEVDKVRQAAALFERVASGGPGTHKALAHYYAGLANMRAVNIMGDENKEKTLERIDVAVEHFKTATDQQDDFAEAYALLASAYGRKMGLDPRQGMFLGPKSSQLLKKAHALAPDNPRVVFIQATSDYFTPETWGGSKKKAMQGFRHAIELFEQQEESTDPLQPDWGHSDSYAWLGFAHLQNEEYEKARQAFRDALEINPDFGWVQEVLLPRLQSKVDSTDASGGG